MCSEANTQFNLVGVFNMPNSKQAKPVEIAVPTSDTSKLETSEELVGMVHALVNGETIEERISNIESMDIGVEVHDIKKQLTDDSNDLENLRKIVYELRGRLDAVDDLTRQITYLNKFVIHLDAEKSDNEHEHDGEAWFVDHDHNDDYSSEDHTHEITLN